MPQMFIGIDAGADTVAVCVVDDAGHIKGEGCSASASAEVIHLLNSLGTNPNSIIGIEAGWCGVNLTRRLRAIGYTVRVLSTHYVHGFLKLTQNKTDRNDARGIAEIVRLGACAVPDVMVKAHAIQMLRSELVLRHRLISQRVGLENALRSLFRLNGGKLPRAYSGSHLRRIVEEERRRLMNEGTDLSDLILPVAEILVPLRKALEKMERRLAHTATGIATCERFLSIPGVGVICSLSFFTAIEDPHRFQAANDVGPYLGLVPVVSQSGTVTRAGRISRMGNAMTRTHLVTAAISMMGQENKDSDLRRWAVALSERIGRQKAKVALVRKLATVMIAMWKSGEPFRRD